MMDWFVGLKISNIILNQIDLMVDFYIGFNIGINKLSVVWIHHSPRREKIHKK